MSAAAPVSAGVAYVSMVPGSVPAGLQATITDQATGLSVTAVVVDGGFDPVAIVASVGDTLAIKITRTGSAAPVEGVELVRALRPPVVVRTSPPKGQHDVPLNASVIIVFSEPLDSTTLTTGSVQLWRGTTPVSGTVRFADSLHLRAEFHPDALLAGQTDYQLVLSQGIRDVNGVALDSAVTVPFTTGNTAPASGLVFASVSAGYTHTCGVTTSGAAYCWGDNSDGQFGDGTGGNSSTTPVPVAGGLTFANVSAGFFRTCGVTTSGAAYCWGYGKGNLLPLPIAGGLTFVSVSVGLEHECGVTTAGAAYCWGANYYGMFGDGTTASSFDTPVPVAGGLTFAAVSAGYEHSCGVTTTGGAYCWGMNNVGELGIGTSTGPEQCQNGASVACSTMPEAVAGGLTFATVSANGYGTCGVTTSGAPYCWGYNSHGVLGNGTNSGPEQCENSPYVDDWNFTGGCSRVPVMVAGGLNLASLSRGVDWFACGLSSNGAAYCWGSDWAHGDSTAPLAISGGLTFATLSAGYLHACGVTTAGGAYCWGANIWGQLGDGTTAGSNVPVKVAGQP